MIRRRTVIAAMLGMALLMTGCTPLASLFVDGGSNGAEPGPSAATAEPDQTATPQPTPTPIGGADAPLLFVSSRGSSGAIDLYQINLDGSGIARLTDDAATESHPRWSPDRGHIAYLSDVSGLNQVHLLSLPGYEEEQLTDFPGGVAGMTWSPDGTKLALFEADSSDGEIVVVDAGNGEEVTRYATGLEGATNPAWSPRGQAIAFSAMAEGQPRNRDIFSLNLDDGLLTNLTNRAGNDDQPAWSPDGTRLVFQTDRDGSWDLFLMLANGSLQTPLTFTQQSEIEPHWSPDGSLIAFSSDQEGLYHLYVISADGAQVRQLAPVEADDRQPQWPPGPSTLVDLLSYAGREADGQRDIFVATVSGTQDRQVTQTDAEDTTPDWSPDGSQLVIASNRAGGRELYILDSASEEARQLTFDSGSALHPAWSPDGSQIAYEAKSERGDWDVWVIDAKGGVPRNLTDMPKVDDGNPAWSPDGQRLVFSSNRAGSFDLYVMGLDNREEVVRLTDGSGNEVFPSWSPDGATIAYRAESADGSRHQLYLVSVEDGTTEPLFTSRYNDDTPVWAPGGERIVFASDRAGDKRGDYSLYVYSLPTARVERVVQAERDARYPSWRQQTGIVTP
ncbi:MAG: hypothetical protein ACK2UO_22395 [Caldilineaceae bacterium]